MKLRTKIRRWANKNEPEAAFIAIGLIIGIPIIVVKCLIFLSENIHVH